MAKPDLYREWNVHKMERLLESCANAGVTRFIFSSTCAVYGDPQGKLLTEDTPFRPLTPYGETKRDAEALLQKFTARGISSVALRYFNASGAEPRLRVGELHDPESHLIPNVIRAALAGKSVSIFGDDYPTRDGTCIRDYIHVTDLARAHWLAFEKLQKAQAPFFNAVNLGSGTGYSVREIIASIEKVFGGKIQTVISPRRPGDPAQMVAGTERAREWLGFVPQFGLDRIIGDAWAWDHQRLQPKRAVFLDRDGTLNVDPGYLSDAESLELIPGVLDALQKLKAAGYLFYVISNQSGINRGKITLTQIRRIHGRMDALFAREGVRIEEYALCFHHPDEKCDCRKPNPKMILDLAGTYGLSLKDSAMVGDKVTDVEAGLKAGCGHVALLLSGNEADQQLKNLGERPGIPVFKDLNEWATAQVRFESKA
ncbi:MAG: UDP-glucose 4-epimerase GalE [Proteobacteria bacterium]|nr:MAG: UDP-glucose 4-epimerase GalE [Pseudomonadota bacterium]